MKAKVFDKQMSSDDLQRIPLVIPIFDEEMENAALWALRNDRFVSGESVYKFEEEFAEYCGTKYAVSTNSGTDALHLSLLALGVGRQSNVATTAFSFVASANAVLHVGATPIFADIDAKTCNIDPDKLKRRITDHTKAIVPVHLYGYPCDMKRIKEIAESHGLKVVEDACQAHGAEYRGLKAGALGDVGCFSFYTSKNMTVCGDGGMVVTNNQDITEKVAKLRDCGRKAKYVHDLVGYTSRLNSVNAAIGRVQLKRLDQWNEKRRESAALYDKLLSDLTELILPPVGDSNVKPVHHLYVIRTQKRDKLKEWLEQNAIQCGLHYPLPIHLQPIYKELFGFKVGFYPESELASRTCLSIPMHQTLTRDQIRYISEKIHEFYDKTYGGKGVV